LADWVELWRYTAFPDAIHPKFDPKTFGILAKEAEEKANHTLGEEEWEHRPARRPKVLVFNLSRLISCLDESNGGEDFFLKAKTNHQLDLLGTVEKLMKRAEARPKSSCLSSEE